MASDNGGTDREYLRICGMWKNGKMLMSNNFQKRVDRSNGGQKSDEHYKSEENQVRLTVMANKFKSGLMSDERDGDLLLDIKDYDLFIQYLEIVKSDYDAKVAQKSGG